MIRTLRFPMLTMVVVFSFFSKTANAEHTYTIDQIADQMVRLCVGSGRTTTVREGVDGGATLSLRTLSASGDVKGKFEIKKSNADGLVDGIDNALGKVAADEADKVRACLKPVRDRLLDIMLPPQSKSAHGQEKSDIPQKSRQKSASVLDSELERVSEGDRFMDTLFSTADGTEVGDRVRLMLSRPFLNRDFSRVIFPVGSETICRFVRRRSNGRLEGTCDKVILNNGFPVQISGYIGELDGSKGVSIKSGDPVSNYFGKNIYVTLTPINQN